MPTEPFLGVADPISTLTHLAGALVAALALPSLLRAAPAARHARLAFAVFGAACVLLLATSGVYHAIAPDTAARALFQRLDHAAIFVLIAGCYTPVHAWLFSGPMRWGVLGGIWALAVAGITFKSLFFAQVPEAAGLAAYLVLGWIGLGSGWVLWRHRGLRFIRAPLLGGIAFSAGGIVATLGAPNPLPGVIGAHELFHAASLAGILAFWHFIRRDVARATPIGDPFAGADAGQARPLDTACETAR